MTHYSFWALSYFTGQWILSWPWRFVFSYRDFSLFIKRNSFILVSYYFVVWTIGAWIWRNLRFGWWRFSCYRKRCWSLVCQPWIPSICSWSRHSISFWSLRSSSYGNTFLMFFFAIHFICTRTWSFVHRFWMSSSPKRVLTRMKLSFWRVLSWAWQLSLLFFINTIKFWTYPKTGTYWFLS